MLDLNFFFVGMLVFSPCGFIKKLRVFFICTILGFHIGMQTIKHGVFDLSQLNNIF
jgi:hypothetical protein